MVKIHDSNSNSRNIKRMFEEHKIKIIPSGTKITITTTTRRRRRTTTTRTTTTTT